MGFGRQGGVYGRRGWIGERGWRPVRRGADFKKNKLSARGRDSRERRLGGCGGLHESDLGFVVGRPMPDFFFLPCLLQLRRSSFFLASFGPPPAQHTAQHCAAGTTSWWGPCFRTLAVHFYFFANAV